METQRHNSDTTTLPHSDTIPHLPYLRPIFVEHQHFRQWWLWLIVVLMSAAQVGVFGVMYLKFRTFPILLAGGLGAIPIALMILFYSTRLTVRVDVAGVHVRFFPFSRLTIPHHRIVNVEAVTYDPAGEFGGWGIKGPPGRWGWCYTVSGNRGVRIELENRHRVTIGSQRADELADAIRTAREPATTSEGLPLSSRS